MVPKNKAAKPLQVTDVIMASNKPATGLPVLVRLANIVPAENSLPSFPDMPCIMLGAFELEDAAFDREFDRFLDANYPRDQFSGLREFLDQRLGFPLRTYEMYEFIRETRTALRMFASRQQRSRFGLTLYFPWHLVSDWKIDRLRICENCGELFLAERGNKVTCKASCSNARRVREWRKKQAQYEQARKLKAAIPTKQVVKRRREKGGRSNGTHKAK